LTISTLSSLPPAGGAADFEGDGGNIKDNDDGARVDDRRERVRRAP
jgi:hypothetical protein